VPEGVAIDVMFSTGIVHGVAADDRASCTGSSKVVGISTSMMDQSHGVLTPSLLERTFMMMG
jgi:hypothetical protein